MEKLTPKTFVPLFNRFSVRAGESPSGNGSCSARGLARIGNAVLNKDPRLFVNSNTVEKIHDDVVRARDYGLSMMATEFSQGGINFYRYVRGIVSKMRGTCTVTCYFVDRTDVFFLTTISLFPSAPLLRPIISLHRIMSHSTLFVTHTLHQHRQRIRKGGERQLLSFIMYTTQARMSNYY